MSVSSVQMSRTAAPASTGSKGPSPQVHERGVLRDRLMAAFPNVSPAAIGSLVDQAYVRRAGVRVPVLRVLLAEHDVRAALGPERRDVASP